MRLQFPSTKLLETSVKLSRYPIGDITTSIDGGSATKLQIHHLRTSSGTGKLHLIGHEGTQCNFNGYIATTANPEVVEGKLFFHFHNQAFRRKDRTFGRLWKMECSSPEEANKVLAILLLGVDAAKQDYQREQQVARTAIATLYDAETSSEGEEEKSESKKKISYFTTELTLLTLYYCIYFFK